MTDAVPVVTHSVSGTTTLYPDRIEWAGAGGSGVLLFDDLLLAHSPACLAYVAHLRAAYTRQMADHFYWKGEDERFIREHRPLWRKLIEAVR